MVSIGLRRARPEDIAHVMAVERLPGMDNFIGRFDEAEHLRHLADPAWAYLIATDRKGTPIGFVLLNDLDDRGGNVCIKRVAVGTTDKGFGTALMEIVVAWAFRETAAHRLWLNVVAYNRRARHVYAKLGFIEEGVKRQAALLPQGTRADLVMMSLLRPEWTPNA